MAYLLSQTTTTTTHKEYNVHESSSFRAIGSLDKKTTFIVDCIEFWCW